MSNQPATAEHEPATPLAGQVWREADGTLLMCFEPGRVWVQINSMLLVSAADPSLIQPLELVVNADGTLA